MSIGLKANNDGSAAIQVGGSDAITITSSLNTTFAGTVTATGTVAGTTGTLYPLVSGTAVASTSGTSIDFTSIPSWVKRITVILNGVKISGGADALMQTGAGSVTTSGYLGASTRVSSATPATANYTAGFGINVGGGTNTNVHHGAYVLSLVGSNIWVCSGVFAFSNTTITANSSGSITLGGTLDRIRMTTTNGTDTFTAGNINILYE